MAKCKVLHTRKLTLLSLILLVSSVESAVSKSTTLNIADCATAPSNLMLKDPVWGPAYWKFVDVCTVWAPSGAADIRLLTFRYDKAEQGDFFANDSRHDFPGMAVISKNGELLVDIPHDIYSAEIPGQTTVKFSQWHGAFPWRIDLHVQDAGVLETYDRPSLLWKPRQRRYVAGRLCPVQRGSWCYRYDE